MRLPSLTVDYRFGDMREISRPTKMAMPQNKENPTAALPRLPWRNSLIMSFITAIVSTTEIGKSATMNKINSIGIFIILGW